MLETERTIRYLVQERIAITILINKIDRLILELKIPPADAYLKIKLTLEEINEIISSSAYMLPNKENLVVKNDLSFSKQEKISPLLENVIFGSSLYGFVFTLQSFANMYTETMSQKKSNKMHEFKPDTFAKFL